MAPIPMSVNSPVTSRGNLDLLDELISEVEQALRRQAAPQNTIEALVAELQRQVEDHFQDEESGGYFHALLEAAPHLRPRVADLLLQHSELRQKLSRLSDLVFSTKRCPAWWEQANEVFVEFQRRFRDHECKEHALLQQQELPPRKGK